MNIVLIALIAPLLAHSQPRLTNKDISPLGDTEALISAIRGDKVYRCIEQEIVYGKKGRSAALKDKKMGKAAAMEYMQPKLTK